eukprot:240828_1
MAYPSLSINGVGNYFQIFISNTVSDIAFQIPNADQLLPVDNAYHHMNITITRIMIAFSIDNTSYYYHKTNDTKQLTPEVPLTSTLYISSPWSNSIQASIKNIC